MKDETKATIVLSIWLGVFVISLLIATKSRAIGFMMAISATVILGVYLNDDGRKQSVDSRCDNLIKGYERLTEEALRRNDNGYDRSNADHCGSGDSINCCGSADTDGA